VKKNDAHSLRLKLIDRLESENRFDLSAKIKRCGIAAPLVCLDCGFVHLTETRCKNKWCPSCQRGLAETKAARLRFAVKRMRWPIFLTLTQGNSVNIEEEDVREFRRAFGRLRHMKFWKVKVRGGVASMEVTNVGNGWHLHLHAVLDCDWLSILSEPPRKWHTAKEKAWKILVAKSELQEAWRQALKAAYDPICHVKRADGDICQEVLKYVVKGDDLVEMRDDIAPLIDAISTTRLVTTFGTCYGLKAALEIEEPPTAFLCPRGHSAWMPQPLFDAIKSNPACNVAAPRRQKVRIPTRAEAAKEQRKALAVHQLDHMRQEAGKPTRETRPSLKK
jgi:predicted Zn-ribbon and HTH transcriptional regulator